MPSGSGTSRSGSSSRVRVAVASACFVTCALAATPQQPQQPLPTFRGSVNLVVVDVSVLDGDRSPVRGLTRADFTILEDGQPQEISTFSEIHVPDVVTTTAPWTREVDPDVQDNLDQADRRLLVVVLDDATPMPIEDVPRVREMARRVIERMGPRDLTAVVYVVNKKRGQEFTSDRQRLLQALGYFTGGLAGKSKPWQEFDYTALTMYQATLGTLQAVIEGLIDLPDRRKAVVFVSVGLPVDAEKVGPAGLMGEEPAYIQGAAQDLITQMLDLFRAAQSANVNVYGLDPGGLRVKDARLNREFLQALSENTGGRAIISTNDPVPGIVQMFRENGSYYLLGYEAPNPQSKGRYRRIDIRVDRPGVTVRARRGYLEPRAAAPPKPDARPEQLPSPAWRSVASAVPRTGLAVRATAAPFAAPGQPAATVAVVTQVELPVPETAEAVQVDAELLVYAYDVKGKQDGADRTTFRVEVKGVSKRTVVYEVLSRLDLKPGTYQLRIGASSTVLGKDGSVYFDVDVPDFSKGPLTASGVVISATPGTSSGPRDRFASLLPVVPTTQRVFSTEQAVTAFLRVYQPGRKPLVPVLVRARIVDDGSAEVFANSARLDPARFGGARAADYTLPLPLASLTEGEYLLTIEVATEPPSAPGKRASAARPLSSHVRFAVRSD